MEHIGVDGDGLEVDGDEGGHKVEGEAEKVCVAVVCRVNGAVSRRITLHLPTLWTGGAATGLFSCLFWACSFVVWSLIGRRCVVEEYLVI